jgi:hypothetical protein
MHVVHAHFHFGPPLFPDAFKHKLTKIVIGREIRVDDEHPIINEADSFLLTNANSYALF